MYPVVARVGNEAIANSHGRGIDSGLQQNGENENGDHPGDDHSHPKIPLKTKRVTGRFRSGAAVGVYKALVHRRIRLTLADLEAGYGSGSVAAENREQRLIKATAPATPIP